MQIPDDWLDEFIATYKLEFDKELDRVEASAMAMRLIRLYEELYKQARSKDAQQQL
jgi:hypothetical protein